jgi:hypothetical protein
MAWEGKRGISTVFMTSSYHKAREVEEESYGEMKEHRSRNVEIFTTV